VTENGASYIDSVEGEGHVRDERRRDYLREHFIAAHQAIATGVPLAGYFVWSLFDNFEWAEGLSDRFGIVYIDYATQRRIPKTSALWLSHVISANTV